MSTISDTQRLHSQCSDPVGMSDTSSRTKTTQFTRWARKGNVLPPAPLWTDPDHMTFTREAPQKVDPNPAGIATNIVTMLFGIGLVAGLLSLTF